MLVADDDDDAEGNGDRRVNQLVIPMCLLYLCCFFLYYCSYHYC